MNPTDPVAWSVPDQCPRDAFPPAGTDLLGMVCPRNAHIRKVNPRDELDPVDQRRHRPLRRGIPFGPPLPSTIDAPVPAPDKGDPERGLLFLA
jgi:deferrochelatase/peroxidase EfeB